MIYLVYPHDKSRSTAAPWSIGYNLSKGLRKRGHLVQCHDWDEQLCVYPDGPDDILIGHPHPEPGKCFRTSMVAPWKKVISIAPWNGSEEYRRDQEYVWGKVDHHFAICGGAWYCKGAMQDAGWAGTYEHDDPESNGVISTRLDMAIDSSHFPPLKQSYNAPGERRFLYIGCTVPIKGTEYLAKCNTAFPGMNLGHIGNGTIPTATHHGYMDLQSDAAKSLISTYDFLIMPGLHDANPTTVLEAMSWGLIPVLSDGCGYSLSGGDYHGYRLARTCTEDAALIESLQRVDETTLRDLAAKNRELVSSRYTWQRFIDSVALVLEAEDEQVRTPRAVVSGR
tara:strand:+ start:253 stop:1266 length:1014 start_codon:yes stop_codon:yes gene_type:complete